MNDEGYREILGIMLGDSESEQSWHDFFSWLKGRDLRGMDYVVSDGHSGLVKALHANFQGCTWQRCQTHAMRNLLDATPKSVRPELHPGLRAIFEAPDQRSARILLASLTTDYAQKAPKTMSLLEDMFDDVTAVLVLPERYRKRLRTTNGMERLNEEIRRRERVIRILPNRASAIRLLGALLMEIDERWTTGLANWSSLTYGCSLLTPATNRKAGRCIPLTGGHFRNDLLEIYGSTQGTKAHLLSSVGTERPKLIEAVEHRGGAGGDLPNGTLSQFLSSRVVRCASSRISRESLLLVKRKALG